jgi:hypothetical protein
LEFGRRAEGNEAAEIAHGADAAEVMLPPERRRPGVVKKPEQDAELAPGGRFMVQACEISSAPRAQGRVRRLA